MVQKCQLLLDTSASKSFVSKSFYMHCKSLHTLLKFAASKKGIQVGNGQCISMLFIILVIIEVHGPQISNLCSSIQDTLSFRHKKCV